MAARLPILVDDNLRYLKSYQVFLDNSSEHQSVKAFINGPLAEILASIGKGKTALRVMGVGSGTGENDLEILHQLHLQHPGAKVDYEVVEPSSDMLQKYKDLVENTPDLDHVTFTWNKMKMSQFENDCKGRNLEKKMDFIHIIQALYYVEDSEATILFFKSLLEKNGKLLILLVSGEGSWAKLWKIYRPQFGKTDIRESTTMGDLRSLLDSRGIPYQKYELPSKMDITSCFTSGDEKGELLLDFLTQVQDFSKNASPELRAGVLDLLRGPDCSQEVDGKIMFNNNIEALLISP